MLWSSSFQFSYGCWLIVLVTVTLHDLFFCSACDDFVHPNVIAYPRFILSFFSFSLWLIPLGICVFTRGSYFDTFFIPPTLSGQNCCLIRLVSFFFFFNSFVRLLLQHFLQCFVSVIVFRFLPSWEGPACKWVVLQAKERLLPRNLLPRKLRSQEAFSPTDWFPRYEPGAFVLFSKFVRVTGSNMGKRTGGLSCRLMIASGRVRRLFPLLWRCSFSHRGAKHSNTSYQIRPNSAVQSLFESCPEWSVLALQAVVL